MSREVWLAKAVMAGCICFMVFLAVAAGNGMAIAALLLGLLVGVLLPIRPDSSAPTLAEPPFSPVEDWLARMRYEAGRLRTQHDSAVWLDAQGDLTPLCLMSDERLDNLMAFLQRRARYIPHRPLDGQPETTNVYQWIGLVFAEQQRRYEAVFAGQKT